MKVVRHTRDGGFWITPLVAVSNVNGHVRLWFAWLLWLFHIELWSKPVCTCAEHGARHCQQHQPGGVGE